MNWYRSLESRLESGSDDSGVIRGHLGTRRMFMIWLAANLVVTTMLTGTLFVPGIDYVTAVIVIIAGTIIGTIVLTLIGNIGTRTGLATMAITRGAFGPKGSYLPVAANVVILMGWSWVQAMLAGISVNFVVAQTTGFSNPILFSVLCQALVVGLAILGHEGIEKAEPWFALLILAVMAYVFVIAFSGHSPSEYTAVQADPSLEFTPVLALDIVISTAISWTVLSGDLNRLAKSQKSGIIGSGLGYIASTVLAMVLGLTAFSYILLDGAGAAPFDPTALAAEFGWALAIVIFLSVMATEHDGCLWDGQLSRRRAAADEAEVPASGIGARDRLDSRVDLAGPARPVHRLPHNDRGLLRSRVRDPHRRLLHHQESDLYEGYLE